MTIQPIVLVLDDDPAVLRALKEGLESRASFQLLAAQTYSVAWKMLMVSPVDVIVADVILAGGANGIDLCFAAINRYPEVALVLISVDLGREFQSYPLRAVFLRKPFGMFDLIDAISKARVAVSCMIESYAT